MRREDLKKDLPVAYTPRHLKSTKGIDPETSRDMREYGTISSWNDSFVFVDYPAKGGTQGTRIEDLEIIN